ncbi:hypothetical protein C900_03987 [Fulvivirga imtechensis AK7]|uniref:Uncharacterized protein n=1 Tax=Fulvivirga imtechensis AK7 TaxID=1237149 RepID=L8JSH1_9BACT|nr:hypothetical protein [Fulvivirga imtechensis]ELR70302.1 hypothetical protein C900_03987 [Fulvivirga imtechensis AK7]
MTQDLIEALECENETAIVEGFMERYNVSYEEAVDIFTETKKWLWLASKTSEEDTPLFIDKPLLIIDEMWHTFILHTKQYYKFCLQNFRRFVHHQPTPPREKIKAEKELLKNPTKALQRQEERLSRQYSFIYDHLGPETLLKWYEIMAEKYTPEYIKSIKKY